MGKNGEKWEDTLEKWEFHQQKVAGNAVFHPPKWGGHGKWRQVGSFLPWKEVGKTRQNFGTVNEFISKHGIYSIYTENIWKQRLR